MSKKYCPVCKSNKDTNSFSLSSATKDGRGCWCRSCHAAYCRAHKPKAQRQTCTLCQICKPRIASFAVDSLICKRCITNQKKATAVALRQPKLPKQHFRYLPKELPEWQDPLFLLFEQYYEQALTVTSSPLLAGVLASKMMDMCNTPTGTPDEYH